MFEVEMWLLVEGVGHVCYVGFVSWVGEVIRVVEESNESFFEEVFCGDGCECWRECVEQLIGFCGEVVFGVGCSSSLLWFRTQSVVVVGACFAILGDNNLLMEILRDSSSVNLVKECCLVVVDE